MLIAPAGPGTDVQPLLDRGVPVVAFDRLPTSGDLDSVVTASRLAAREATEHLLEQGWQRVACVSGPRGAATATERTLGYTDAVVGRDRSPLVAHTDYKPEGGRLAAAEMLDGSAPPDAFFVANSSMALGVLAELAGRGLVPGRDVGIIGFDDPPWARLLTPPLSAVAQPAHELGRTAARLLHERSTGERDGPARHEVLACSMVVRASSLRVAEPAGPVPVAHA